MHDHPAIVIVAIAGLTCFVDAFADWNKQQACATAIEADTDAEILAGRRNC